MGGSPDQKAADSCESANGVGVYAEASGTLGIIGAGVGANYGATQSFDSKGRVQHSEYKCVSPAECQPLAVRPAEQAGSDPAGRGRREGGNSQPVRPVRRMGPDHLGHRPEGVARHLNFQRFR